MWSIRFPLSSSYRTCSRMPHFTWVDCTDDPLIRNGRGPVCTTSAPTKNYTPTKENEAGKWTTEIKTSRLTPDRIQTCTTRSSLAFSSICHDCGLYMIPSKDKVLKTAPTVSLFSVWEFSGLRRAQTSCWLNSLHLPPAAAGFSATSKLLKEHFHQNQSFTWHTQNVNQSTLKTTRTCNVMVCI